jgi:hypothetical protein
MDLYAAKDFDTRFKVYEHYITALGFDGASFTYVPYLFINNAIHLSPLFRITTHYPQAFIEQYNTEHWEQHDFTISELKNNNFTIKDWQDSFKHKLLTLEAKRQLVVVKTDYNIQNALSIPMRVNAGVCGTSIISHEKNRAFNKLKKESLEVLQIMTHTFSNHNFSDQDLATCFIAPYLEFFKPKELEVLKYIAAGKPIKNIGLELDISKRYAANLLDQVRERLGDISRDKLMYLCGEFQIFDARRQAEANNSL